MTQSSFVIQQHAGEQSKRLMWSCNLHVTYPQRKLKTAQRPDQLLIGNVQVVRASHDKSGVYCPRQPTPYSSSSPPSANLRNTSSSVVCPS